MRLVNRRALVFAVAGFGLAACGDDVTVTPAPLQFTTNPTAVSCTTGQATAVGLSVTGGSGTPTITFTPTGSAITAGTTSGSTFTFTCGNTAGAGAIGFTITSGGQTVTGSIPVTVTVAPGGGAATAIAISINPQSVSLVQGGTQTFTASVTLASGAPATTSTAATFASSDTTIARVVNNANGTATVTAVVSATNTPGRQAVITATSVANPNLRAFATVTVAAGSSLVSSLTVQPTTVSLTTGGTQQITPTVTLAASAPAGTSTGVTYTSSDTSIAKVSTTGLITAGARAGTAVITVASTAAPSIQQQISVTVGVPAPVRLTIQGIRVVNAAGNLVPADLTNVAGNLFVTLNLDPGDFRPDSVRLRLGSQTVLCQRFSVQLAEAYRLARTTGAADVQPIDCQVNTSAFNARLDANGNVVAIDPTQPVGLPNAVNGTQTLTAEVFFRPQGAPAGTASTQQAAITQSLVLNNQSGFFVNITNKPTAAQIANGGPASGQATGPQGVLWRAGDISVSVLPVNFSGTGGTTGAPLSVTVSLVDNNGTVATSTATNVAAGAAATTTFTGATAAYTPLPGNNTVTGYTSPNAGVPNGGTFVQIGGGANTVILNASGTQIGAPAIFIDNSSPEARSQFVSPNFILAGQSAGFINGSFVFADSVQQAAAATLLADNNGVDRVARTFFVANNAAGITANGIVSGGTATVNGSSLAQNINQTTFVAAARLVDALGNAAAVPVTATNGGAIFTFGVITATPTVSTVTAGTNLGANAQVGITTTTPRTITFQATSTAGAAFPTNFMIGTLQVTNANGTFCAVAADVDGTGKLTGVSTTATTPPCPTLAFNGVLIDPLTAVAGVYTVNAQARDVAGNLSAAFTRSFAIDRVAPVVVNAFAASPPLTGGQSESFTATATDNLGLVAQAALVDYPTGPELIFRYNGTAIATALATPFTRSATLSVQIPTFLRAIALQAQTAANQFVNVNSAAFNTPTGIAVGASDEGNNWGYSTVGTPQLDQTQTIPTFFNGTGPTSASLTFFPTTASSASTAGFAATLAPATTGTPTSQTINFVLNGAVNSSFVTPFSRVELYLRGTVPGNAQGANPFTSSTNYTLISQCSGPATSVSAINNQTTITNSCPVIPGSGGIPAFPSSGTTAVDLLLVASDANGNAIAFIIPTITLTP